MLNCVTNKIGTGQEEEDCKIGDNESRGSLDTDSSKRQKTEESAKGSLTEGLPAKFHKLKSKVRKRNYRMKKNLNDDDQDQRNSDDPIDGVSTNSSSNEDMESQLPLVFLIYLFFCLKMDFKFDSFSFSQRSGESYQRQRVSINCER